MTELVPLRALAGALRAFRKGDGNTLTDDQYETLIMLVYNAIDAKAAALSFEAWEHACIKF